MLRFTPEAGKPSTGKLRLQRQSCIAIGACPHCLQMLPLLPCNIRGAAMQQSRLVSMPASAHH